MLKSDYRDLQNRAIRAAETARHVASELHPSELDDLGLPKALRAYCEQLSKEDGVLVEFSSHKLPARLKREVASSLYKVAQEALRNFLKHSQAKRAKVALNGDGRCVRLRVEDQGVGFPIAELQSAAGLGVASMRERVELVNGKFAIASEPGKGTVVTAEIPLRGSEEDV